MTLHDFAVMVLPFAVIPGWIAIASIVIFALSVAFVWGLLAAFKAVFLRR